MYLKDFGIFKKKFQLLIRDEEHFNDSAIENVFGTFILSSLPPTEGQVQKILDLVKKHRLSIHDEVEARWHELQEGRIKKR